MEKLKNHEDFGNLLNNRLHTILLYLEDINDDLTIFVQLLKNSSFEGKNNFQFLSYAGLDEQKIRLVKNNKRLDLKGEYHQAWEFLKNTHLGRDTPNVETFPFFEVFKSGDLTLRDIKVERLKDYFSYSSNKIQEIEYCILSKHFEIETALYVIFPLISFGEINGLISIIFGKKDLNIFKDEVALKRIIKNFSIEYEKLIISWGDITLLNKKSDFNVVLDSLQSKIYYDKINTNPILKSLDLLNYYIDSNIYYRVNLNRLIYVNNVSNPDSNKQLTSYLQLSTFWEVPSVLQNAFHQFLIYFSNFSADFYNVSFEFNVRRKENGFELTINDSTSQNIILIDRILSIYLGVVFDDEKRNKHLLEKQFDNPVQQFHNNQAIKELKLENKLLKTKIRGQLDKLALINSLSEEQSSNHSLKVNIQYFTSKNMSELDFSRSNDALKLENKLSSIARLENTVSGEIQTNIRLLLEKGKIIDALEILDNYFNVSVDYTNQNKILLLKHRFRKAKEEKNLGVISLDEFNIQENNIYLAILECLSA